MSIDTTARKQMRHARRSTPRDIRHDVPRADLLSSQPRGSSEEALLAERVYVRYRNASGDVGTPAVRDVTLAIGRGEHVAIVGESGSGKSTFALAVAGFLDGHVAEVEASRLRVAGREASGTVAERLPRRRPGVTMMFQDAMTSLDPVWTVGSQLRAVLGAQGRQTRRDREERCRYWLDRVGLRDTRRVLASRPGELSGGMRQRVMLALALASEPELLVADEPTSALDASLAREVMELLLELTETSDASVLIVSHDITLCAQYVDRIAVMYRGELVETIAADALDDARHPYTRALLACVPTLDSASRDRLPTLADYDVLPPDAA